MADKDWKSGDKVKLASGGPPMTVQSVGIPLYGSKPMVSCQWFDKDGKLQKGSFPPESLVADDG
jgi:uncharacterized protein YodC (DUF2158 family)